MKTIGATEEEWSRADPRDRFKTTCGQYLIRVDREKDESGDDLICDQCEARKKSVVLRPDPFQEEINGIIDERWLCDDCHHSLSMDI